MSNVLLLIAGFLLSSSAILSAQIAVPLDRVDHHISYLASDDLEGRRAAERGNLLAAGYIAGIFAELGLERPNGSYFHYFDLAVDVNVLPASALRFEGFPDSDGGILDPSAEPLLLDREWAPLGFSENASLYAPVVFAGYAISSPDDKYDDFAGLDVEGKIVVALRESPQFDDPHNPLRRHAPFERKISAVREHGGIGLILIDLSDRSGDGPISTHISRAVGSAGIPVASISPEVAGRFFPGGLAGLRSLAAGIDSTLQPASMEFPGLNAELNVSLEVVKEPVPNVLGLLPGNDPALAREIIVVGGHYDHLGRGGIGSLHDGGYGEIHNGADDNASGIAALLSVAEHYIRHGSGRSILFVGFNAEELGLLGSAALVENPPFDLGNVVAMINLDMVGRLSENGLTVGGTGTSPVWTPILDNLTRPAAVTVNYTEPGMGPSDHTSFYLKEVPVLFFFTGLHGDYHRPSDDIERVDVEGVRTIVGMVSGVIDALQSRSSENIAFTPTKSPKSSASAFSVYFGIVPDYGFSGEGLRITGVSTGSPAEEAGLAGGDILRGVGEWDIDDIYDLTHILGKLSPGDEMPVRYLRDGKPGAATVKFQAR